MWMDIRTHASLNAVVGSECVLLSCRLFISRVGEKGEKTQLDITLFYAASLLSSSASCGLVTGSG